MKRVKQVLRFFFVGALVGAAIGSVAAPPIVNALHVRAAAMCDCSELADRIVITFYELQGGGALIGGIGGIVVWAILRRKGKLK